MWHDTFKRTSPFAQVQALVVACMQRAVQVQLLLAALLALIN
jgi:hypothetical protein